MNENIKNIAKIINSKRRFQNCNDCIKSEDTCWEFETAIALHNAGYCQESEVVKEFAEKVNRKVEIECDSNFNISIYNLEALTETIAAEFGKEDTI